MDLQLISLGFLRGSHSTGFYSVTGNWTCGRITGVGIRESRRWGTVSDVLAARIRGAYVAEGVLASTRPRETCAAEGGGVGKAVCVLVEDTPLSNPEGVGGLAREVGRSGRWGGASLLHDSLDTPEGEDRMPARVFEVPNVSTFVGHAGGFRNHPTNTCIVGEASKSEPGER
ncbi:hypothetical protein C8R44DRAFT_862739 [Mycena epipterygia]|nr:hypothetical protein C8R44DRAFT_862739 [Mycena epipterygia]